MHQIITKKEQSKHMETMYISILSLAYMSKNILFVEQMYRLQNDHIV